MRCPRRHRQASSANRTAETGLERWRTGRRDVVFPMGTWLMRELHGATVDGLDIAAVDASRAPP